MGRNTPHQWISHRLVSIFIKIHGQTPTGITGTRIWRGQTFNYIASSANRNVTVAPNPLYVEQGKTPVVLSKRLNRLKSMILSEV